MKPKDFPTVIVTGRADERYHYADMYEKDYGLLTRQRKLVKNNSHKAIYEMPNGVRQTFIYVSVRQVLHGGLDGEMAHEIYITDTGMQVLFQCDHVEGFFSILHGVRMSWPIGEVKC